MFEPMQMDLFHLEALKRVIRLFLLMWPLIDVFTCRGVKQE